MDVVRGPRLWWIVFALCLGLFLSSLESTIVATALVSISVDFNDYEQSNWVIIIYLVTYSGFLIIYARISDTIGRKPALLTGLCFFTIGSLACGLARSLLQLIVFRAFQGLGGAGIYALAMVLVVEITPAEQYGIVWGMLGMVFAFASAVGPVVGGAIASSTTWRWCFYLNVPGGALVMLVTVLLLPTTSHTPENSVVGSVTHIDWLGSCLSVAASITTIIPLEAGGNQFAWNSGAVIVCFVVAGLCWITFAAWETWLACGSHSILPLFPIRLALHRVIGACILSAMLTGISFTGTIVYLPQRFQVANGLTPIMAGTHMLPLVIVSAVTTSVAGLVLTKNNICAWMILGGNALQLVGLSLLSLPHTSTAVENVNYGYQVVLGIGFGLTLSSSVILVRIEAERKDVASLVGAISQLRVFGGVIGVALCRIILSSYVRASLADKLSPDTLSSILSDLSVIEGLTIEDRDIVRQVYENGFSSQSRILMYIAAGNVIVSLFTFRRHAKPIKEAAPYQEEQIREEKQEIGGDVKASSD